MDPLCQHSDKRDGCPNYTDIVLLAADVANLKVGYKHLEASMKNAEETLIEMKTTAKILNEGAAQFRKDHEERLRFTERFAVGVGAVCVTGSGVVTLLVNWSKLFG